MKEPVDINILIIRLFSGEANSNEKTTVRNWLKASSENRAFYSEMQDLWLASGVADNRDKYNLEEALEKFSKHVHPNGTSRLKKDTIYKLYRYAAILVLLIGLPVMYYWGVSSSKSDRLTTISCAYGDRTSVLLPDSSEVWLNSGSELSFKSDFGGNRHIKLKGEAFFSVTKDSRHPFVVSANEINVKVLGTRFNVKAYPEEEIVSTTLVEGRVRVLTDTQESEIKPSQQLVFNRRSQKMEINDLTDTEMQTGWKEGRFVFRNETLAKITPRLERWFDVNIEFADDVAKTRRFTGVLFHENILEAISYFNQSKYIDCQVKGDKIVIKSESN